MCPLFKEYNYDGTIVEHKIDSSWYHLSGQYNPANITHQFWTYIGYISGSTNIVGINPVNFSVLNNATVNYSWSITSGYQNIYISSSPYQDYITLVPTHSGTAVLQLTLTSTASRTPRTQQVSLNITTNVCLEGSYDHGGVYYINLNTSIMLLRVVFTFGFRAQTQLQLLGKKHQEILMGTFLMGILHLLT